MKRNELEFFKEPRTKIRKRQKTATTRKEKEADVGDVFTTGEGSNLRVFEITHVIETPLPTAVAAFYEQEGYNSPEQFYKKLYAIYGDELVELIDEAYVHLFTEVTGEQRLEYLDQLNIGDTLPDGWYAASEVHHLHGVRGHVETWYRHESGYSATVWRGITDAYAESVCGETGESAVVVQSPDGDREYGTVFDSVEEAREELYPMMRNTP